MEVFAAYQQIRQAMQELGYQSGEYIIRYRDFAITGNSTTEIEAYNEVLIILGEPQAWFSISSGFGNHDAAQLSRYNELQHQHSGLVKVTSTAPSKTRLRFLQAIAKNSAVAKRTTPQKQHSNDS